MRKRVFRPPCSAAEIEDLVQRSTEELGAAPPAGYCEFLRRSDGIEYNGLMIYRGLQPPDGDAWLPGFVEINRDRFRGDLKGFERTLVFGENSLGFHALDLDTGVYRSESWGGHLVGEFKTFEELLDSALATVVKDGAE